MTDNEIRAKVQMSRKTASRTAAVWAYCLNYLAGALFLLHALANLTGVG